MADFFSRIYERFSQEFFQELCQIFPIDLHKRLDKMSKGMQRQAYLILALSSKRDSYFWTKPLTALIRLCAKTCGA
jgi:ABC-2 type transport system ATP-binding protein